MKGHPVYPKHKAQHMTCPQRFDHSVQTDPFPLAAVHGQLLQHINNSNFVLYQMHSQLNFSVTASENRSHNSNVN